MQPHVVSEVEPLKTVLVHRPGSEMSRLTPSNMGELLFDDLIWLERAQEEHDAMTDQMRARGIEVLYFDELLTEALEVPAAAMRPSNWSSRSAPSVLLPLMRCGHSVRLWVRANWRICSSGG